MCTKAIRKLWMTHRDPEVREALVDTLVLALDIKPVFSGPQMLAAIRCMTELFGVTGNNEMLAWLKASVKRVNEVERSAAIQRMAGRLEHLGMAQRETVLKLALVGSTLLSPGDERLAGPEWLAGYGAALGVPGCVDKVVDELRREMEATSGMRSAFQPSSQDADQQTLTAAALRDYKMHYDRGRDYEASGQYALAQQEYAEAIRLNPHDPDAHIGQGSVYDELGQPEKAIACYQEAERVAPDNCQPGYNIACIYAKQRAMDALLPHLRRALDIDGDYCLDALVTDSDFDLVRDDARFQALLAEFGEVAPEVIKREVLHNYVCDQCRQRGLYVSEIRYGQAEMTFYRCANPQCGYSWPSAAFGYDVKIFHKRTCPRCKRAGIYYLGSAGSPGRNSEVEHFYRCAYADCKHEWSVEA